MTRYSSSWQQSKMICNKYSNRYRPYRYRRNWKKHKKGRQYEFQIQFVRQYRLTEIGEAAINTKLCMNTYQVELKPYTVQRLSINRQTSMIIRSTSNSNRYTLHKHNSNSKKQLKEYRGLTKKMNQQCSTKPENEQTKASPPIDRQSKTQCGLTKK